MAAAGIVNKVVLSLKVVLILWNLIDVWMDYVLLTKLVVSSCLEQLRLILEMGTHPIVSSDLACNITRILWDVRMEHVDQLFSTTPKQHTIQVVWHILGVRWKLHINVQLVSVSSLKTPA